MVLLGEFYCELVEDFPGVSLEGGVECAITVHHDEAEGRLVDEQLLLEFFQVELGVAVVDREVNRLEGLEVADQLLLCGGSLIHDPTGEQDKSVIGRPLVEFESLTSRLLSLYHCCSIVLILDLCSFAGLFVEEPSDI